MKKFYATLCFTFILAGSSYAQTIWNGPKTTFTKANFADFTQATNQDRITPNVWITRGDTKGIYNFVSETFYTNSLSPDDTEWAFGTTSNIATLTFDNWEDVVSHDPPSSVNMDMVMHIIPDDIYIDVKFTQWSEGTAGGGFVYERSTDPNVGLNEISTNDVARLFPNPTKDFIQVSGIQEKVTYTIYSIGGQALLSGETTGEEKINIQNLGIGKYLIKLDNNTSLTFSKN